MQPKQDIPNERRTPQQRGNDRDPNVKVVTLISGNCFVTDQPNHMIVTILGSCVAACMRDPVCEGGGHESFFVTGKS